MNRFFLIVVAVVFASCSHPSGFYGNTFDTAHAVSVSALTESMSAGAAESITVSGTIESVCQAEGCWLTLRNPGSESVFVDWDHAFDIPKNASGKRAYVAGLVYLDTTSVEELQHFARDEGKSEEEISRITEPKIQLSIKATGVYL